MCLNPITADSSIEATLGKLFAQVYNNMSLKQRFDLTRFYSEVQFLVSYTTSKCGFRIKIDVTFGKHLPSLRKELKSMKTICMKYYFNEASFHIIRMNDMKWTDAEETEQGIIGYS